MASVYVIFGIADVFVGAIRGCGVPIVPVIINLLGTCAFRLLWIAWLDTSRYGVEWVYISYPVSWVLILVALVPFWFHLRRKKHAAVMDAACYAGGRGPERHGSENRKDMMRYEGAECRIKTADL